MATVLVRDTARELRLRSALAALGVRTSPFCVDEAGSTLDVMAALADEGAPEGTLVLAARQTAGRGRFDRAWASPPGGLYLSVLHRPREPAAPDASALGGLAASLALLDAVEALGAQGVTLKWPNDLLHDGRKLAGLLARGGEDGRGAPYVALGVGVNVRSPAGALPDVAITLQEILAQTVDIDALVLTFLPRWFERLARLRRGEPPPLQEDWLSRSGWRGRTARVAPEVRTPGRTVDGVVTGLGGAGELLLRCADGSERAFAHGDATIAKEAAR